MALSFIGNRTFTQQGSVRWIPNGWDLDRLIVPMRGPITGLNAYLASLTMWSPSTIDGNMFLSDFPTDGHPQYPTVELTYMGKRNGKLPPDKNGSGQVIQQSSHKFPIYSYEFTYIAPTSQITTFSRSPINVAAVSPSRPANAQVINVEVTGPLGTFSNPSNSGFSQAFQQKLVTTARSEELVPGRYFRAEVTQTNLFFAT